MKILKEYSPSLPINISAAEDVLFSKLLKKELKIRSVSASNLTFSSNGYCGLLTIAGNAHFIIPQFGEHMLEVLLPLVFGINQKSFLNPSGLAQGGLKYADGIASIFLNAYSLIESESLRFDYNQHYTKGLLSSGALSVEKSLLFLTSGMGAPVWRQGVYEIDTKLNQAVKYVFHNLMTSFPVASRTRILIARVLSHLEGVKPTVAPDYPHLLSTLNRTTEHYKTFLEFASAFEMGMNQSGGSANSVCCLFESWRVFQQAIKNTIDLLIVGGDLASNSKSGLSLEYTEGGRRLDPDILIFNRNPSIVALGDVKYSENENLELERSNMFQMNAYMDGYNFDNSFLVYPTVNNFSHKRYDLRWGKTICVYKIPVSSYKAFMEGVKTLVQNECYLSRSPLTSKIS